MGYKAIVVDFDVDMLYSLSNALSHSGFQAFPVCSLKIFKSTIASINPDIVLVDWRCCMKEASLCEFLHDNFPALPVLIVSSAPGTAGEIASRYNFSLLESPFDVDRLIASIETLIKAA